MSKQLQTTANYQQGGTETWNKQQQRGKIYVPSCWHPEIAGVAYHYKQATFQVKKCEGLC